MQQEKKTSRQHPLKSTHALVALAIALAPTLSHAQTRSGTLDASFGTGGKVTTDFAGSGDGVGGIAVQPDGKLVAAGAASINWQLDFALARYDSNGTLDTSFGTNGRVTTDFGGVYEAASSVALQSDGRIVVAGWSVLGYYNNFALARYLVDGTLDTSFGTGGKVVTNFGEVSAQGSSVAVQPDGKIVVAGYANIDGGYDFALVRYNANGSLDASFGPGGKVVTEFGVLQQGYSFAEGSSVALQQDGKIVVAGVAYIGPGRDFAVARYNSDGTLDNAFGSGGKVMTDFSRNDSAFSVAVGPDGKIVIAGMSDVERGFGFALVRYSSDGTLDTSFGTGGRVTTDFGLLDQGFSNASVSSLAIQPDGRMVATGRAYFNGNFHSGMARYNSDGTLDTNFGTGGKVAASFDSPWGQDAFGAVVLQLDGKIVVAVGGLGDFTLVRYNN
jgi:uncharacterized delta-60 repeat protein